MTAKLDKKTICKMRKSGISCAEIGENLGISRQRVYQILNESGFPSAYTRKKHVCLIVQGCIYPNIKKWMIEHNKNYTNLSKDSGVSYVTIHKFLVGEIENIGKNTIDSILKTTGLKYEEAFSKIESN